MKTRKIHEEEIDLNALSESFREGFSPLFFQWLDVLTPSECVYLCAIIGIRNIPANRGEIWWLWTSSFACSRLRMSSSREARIGRNLQRKGILEFEKNLSGQRLVKIDLSPLV